MKFSRRAYFHSVIALWNCHFASDGRQLNRTAEWVHDPTLTWNFRVRSPLPQFSCHFLRICWSFIDFIRPVVIVSAPGAVFIGILLEDIVWGSARVDFRLWCLNVTPEIIKSLKNSSLSKYFSNLKNIPNASSTTHPPTLLQRMHHSLRISCTMERAPWQVSFSAREQQSQKV